VDVTPALALNIHMGKELLLHVAERDGLGLLEDTIGKGGFAVVDVCDYAEIAYLGKIACISHVF